MGAGVSQQRLDRALRRAKKVAEEHTRKYGTPCQARLIRASNGEAAIVYDVTHLNGEKFTLFDLNDAAFKAAKT